MNLHRLILCTLGVAALSCTAFADSLTVSGSTLAETDKSYDGADSERAALTLGEMAAYTGTNITLSATGNGYSGAHVGTESSLSLTNSVVTSSGDYGWGIYVVGGGRVRLNDTSIRTSGGAGDGVYVLQGSYFEQTGGSITTAGDDAHGLYLDKSGKAKLTGVNVKTSGNKSHGVHLMDGENLMLSDLVLLNSTISVTGSGAHGIDVRGTNFGRGWAGMKLDHSTLTGDIYSSASYIFAITASNGSVITGDVSSGTKSIISLTLTGTGTVLHGNFAPGGGFHQLILDAGAVFDGGGELYGLTLKNGAIIVFTGGSLRVTDYFRVTGEDDIITIDFSGLTEAGAYTVLDWSAAAKVIGPISVSHFTATGAEGTFSVEHGKLYFNTTAVSDRQTQKLNRIIKGYDRVTEADKSYNDTNSELAVLTLGKLAAYTGTNITLSATSDYHSGAHVGAKASLSLTNSAITTTGDAAHGLYLHKMSQTSLTGVNVKTSGNKSHGVSIMDEGGIGQIINLRLADSNIGVTGSGAHGIDVDSTDPGINITDVSLNHSTLTGDIYHNSGNNNFNLTASNGSVITGDVISGTKSIISLTLTGTGTVLHGNFAPDGGDCWLTLGAGAVFDGGGELSGLTLQNGAIYAYNPAHGKLTITNIFTINEDTNITINFSGLTEAAGIYTVLDWSAAKEILNFGRPISASRFTATGAEGTFSVKNGKLYFSATAVFGRHRLLLNISHGAVLLALVLGVLFVMRRRANLNHQKTKKP
jgi:hypothetical protein